MTKIIKIRCTFGTRESVSPFLGLYGSNGFECVAVGNWCHWLTADISE